MVVSARPVCSSRIIMSRVALRSLLVLLLLQVGLRQASGEAVQVTAQNYEQFKASTDIILLNFYADWCRFSQQLKPVYDKAATMMAEQSDANVLFGKINCESEKGLCANPFHVSKYPTLKLVRYGQVARREYRGKRSADALVEYVKEQLKDPVQALNEYYDITKMDVKRAVVGFFPSNTTYEYQSYRKVAINLRDDCPFYAVLGQNAPQILFREEGQQDAIYTGDINDFYNTFMWIYDKCIPLVREITFQNGEEMTEEGVPLLILFYHPNEPEIKELFKSRVAEELADQKGIINAVTADGVTFAHPLHHLGKSQKDLPVMAIDSFRHMYVFPNFEDIKLAGKLKEFVNDLQSGKLHREFHHGPDPTAPPSTQSPQHVPSSPDKRSAPEDPPESTFRKLRPDRSRYTLLRDEL